jgi:hypothetical protein
VVVVAARQSRRTALILSLRVAVAVGDADMEELQVLAVQAVVLRDRLLS